MSSVLSAVYSENISRNECKGLADYASAQEQPRFPVLRDLQFGGSGTPVKASRRESPFCRRVTRTGTVRSMGRLSQWRPVRNAYKVRGDDALAGVTRIDGCPGVSSGP
jgi:hypothetical protein